MCMCVWVYPTVSDKCSASQHSSQHELGHSQQSTWEPAHYRHTEEEVILQKNREEKIEKQIIFIIGCGKTCVLDNIKRGKDKAYKQT